MSNRQARWNLNIHFHRVVLDAVPARASNALDVGCGNGLLSFELASRGLRVIGVDPDAPSVERARTDPGASDRTAFVCADVFTHAFEPASFDVVASSATLHDVDAERGLRRMRELVRPGGVLAIVGFARPSGPRDLALIASGFVYKTAREVQGRYWEHAAPIRWPPPLSIGQMRALAERELPGLGSIDVWRIGTRSCGSHSKRAHGLVTVISSARTDHRRFAASADARICR